VQEEYDLANNIDQMSTRLDSFDEYRYLKEKASQCHLYDANMFQNLVNEGLGTPRQKEYLKQIF